MALSGDEQLAHCGDDGAFERLAGHLKGEEAALRVQLLMEYAPALSFRNDTPRETGPTHVADLNGRVPWMDGQIDNAAKRLGIAA